MFVVITEWVAWTFVGLGVTGLMLRFTDIPGQVTVVLAAGAWLLALTPFAGLVLHLVVASPSGAASAAIVCLAELWVYLPLFVRRRAGPDGHSVRLFTQNLLLGGADERHIVATVDRDAVDLFFAQELTEAAQERLVTAGLERRLPYRWSSPDHSAFGAGV